MPRPSSMEARLARRLAEEPLRVPARLAAVLAREADVCKRLLGINPRTLRATDKARVDELDALVSRYLESVGKAALFEYWKGPSARLRDICDYGVSGRVETIVAMMLAGAAIARTDIKVERLRPGLAAGLLAACKLQRQTPPPQKPHPLALAYAGLRLDAAQSVVAKDLAILLTDHGRVPRLRLGRALASLDPVAIEDHRVRHFGGVQRHAATGRRQGQLLKDAALAVPALTAPDAVELVLARATCQQQQDDTGVDRVFWLSHFCRVSNLDALYAQIDAAIKSGTFGEVVLNVQTETLVRQTPLVEFNSNQGKPVGASLGGVNLVQGFGPWACQVVCYEDDDQEYAAVQEVLGQVSDYADFVSQGAQVVSVVAGPTVVGAGAAAVSTAASAVSLAADVTSAVVSVVNFLDENDYIGRASLTGRADYLREPAGDLALPAADIGSYVMELTERRTGTETVTRNWEVKTTAGHGETLTTSAGAFAGLSEDYTVSFKMDEYTDKMVLAWVNHTCVDEGWDGDLGWWSWRTYPVLSANDHLTVVGEFHVGQAGYGEVKDTPWAQGIRLLEPPL